MDLEFVNPYYPRHVDCRFNDGVEASVAMPSIEGEISAKTGERGRFLHDVEIALEDPTHKIMASVLFDRLPIIVKDLNRRALRFNAVTQSVYDLAPLAYDPTKRVPGHRVEAQMLARMRDQFIIFHAYNITKQQI